MERTQRHSAAPPAVKLNVCVLIHENVQASAQTQKRTSLLNETKKGPQDSSVKTERADVADEIKTGVVTVV